MECLELRRIAKYWIQIGSDICNFWLHTYFIYYLVKFDSQQTLTSISDIANFMKRVWRLGQKVTYARQNFPGEWLAIRVCWADRTKERRSRYNLMKMCTQAPSISCRKMDYAYVRCFIMLLKTSHYFTIEPHFSFSYFNSTKL